jgi:hypothetical protein
MKKTHRRRSNYSKNKRNERNKTRKIRKASGGNPTELTDEHPIQIVGNELYVNLNNAYYAGPGKKQHYTGEHPVYIYNLLDLNIDEDGKMFRVYPPDKKVYYGKIDEYNNFTIDTGYKFIDRYPNAIYIDDMIRGIQLMYIENVMIKPGNSNEGEFKTVFPLRHDRTNEAPITLAQNAIMNNKTSKNADKQAKYIIFDRKNMKMYANYAFICIFKPPIKRKSPGQGKSGIKEGYLKFEKAEAPPKAEVLEELERVVPLMPYEVEGSEIGKEYREARARFESRNPDWARTPPPIPEEEPI